MVKVTVLYNLASGADEEAFLRWRLTEHQERNASAPGVVRADFYVAEETPLGPPRYRFITEVYYRDMDALRRHFLAPETQDAIRRWIAEHRLTDFTVLVSRQRAASERRPGAGRGGSRRTGAGGPSGAGSGAGPPRRREG